MFHHFERLERIIREICNPASGIIVNSSIKLVERSPPPIIESLLIATLSTAPKWTAYGVRANNIEQI